MIANSHKHIISLYIFVNSKVAFGCACQVARKIVACSLIQKDGSQLSLQLDEVCKIIENLLMQGRVLIKSRTFQLIDFDIL